MVSFDETFIIYKMQYFWIGLRILNILYYAIIATEKPLFENYSKSSSNYGAFCIPSICAQQHGYSSGGGTMSATEME